MKCGIQLYCENRLDNYLYISVKGSSPITKVKYFWEGLEYAKEGWHTVNLPKANGNIIIQLNAGQLNASLGQLVLHIFCI